MPIVVTVLTELATVVFLGLGLGHRQPTRIQTPAPVTIDVTPVTSKHDAVASFAKAFDKRHGRAPRWVDVRAAGYSKATASRGLKRLAQS